MIQIATVVPTVTPAPVPSALRVAESGASAFALALSSLLAPGIKAGAKPTAPAAPETALRALQIAAEPGKELPDALLELPKHEAEAAPESEGDDQPETPAEQDPAFAWFALPAPPVTDQPIAIVAALARAVRVDTPESAALVSDAPTAAAAKAQFAPGKKVADAAPLAEAPPEQQQADARAALPAMGAERGSVAVPRAVPVISGEAPAPLAAPPAAAPVAPIEARAVVAPPPEARVDTPAPAAPAAPRAPATPAPEITAAPALAAAAPPAAAPIALAPLRRAVPREPDQPSMTSIAAPSAAALQQVAAAPQAQQGALDLRRQEWMGQMVERIEALRDAAPVRETRIALMPDALGKVDIAVRHDGDRVHVQFSAETQAARQILNDAQPRLAELAEARGVRLGQTSVDLGQSGANPHSGQRQDGQRPQTPSAPPRVRAGTEFTATEDRVA